ncbi:MAG: hypothetical protein ACRD0C_06670 [Acidimicrobiia bacterium]
MAKGPKKKNIRKPKARKSGTMGFAAVIGVIALLGVVGIVASKSGDSAGAATGPDIGEHHHAALGINICGQWKPNTPQYESAKGIHSHGDGFIHMHPYSRAGANENATVGLFLSQADEKVTNDSIKLGDGTDLKNGDECVNLDGKPGKLRWSVNGEEKKGNPARYVPNDRDVIALAFLPEGEDIGTPPIAGSNPSDLGGEVPVTPTAPGQTDPNQLPPASTTESTEAPATTATTQ